MAAAAFYPKWFNPKLNDGSFIKLTTAMEKRMLSRMPVGATFSIKLIFRMLMGIPIRMKIWMPKWAGSCGRAMHTAHGTMPVKSDFWQKLRENTLNFVPIQTKLCLLFAAATF
jgi:hypothetical protein